MKSSASYENSKTIKNKPKPLPQSILHLLLPKDNHLKKTKTCTYISGNAKNGSVIKNLAVHSSGRHHKYTIKQVAR